MLWGDAACCARDRRRGGGAHRRAAAAHAVYARPGEEGARLAAPHMWTGAPETGRPLCSQSAKRIHPRDPLDHGHNQLYVCAPELSHCRPLSLA